MNLMKDGDVDRLNTFIGLTKDLIKIVKAQAELLQRFSNSTMSIKNRDITYLGCDGKDIIRKLEFLLSPTKKYRKKILNVEAYQFKMPNLRPTRSTNQESEEQPGVLWYDFGSSIMHPYCMGNGNSKIHVYDEDWIVFEHGRYVPMSTPNFNLFYMEDK